MGTLTFISGMIILLCGISIYDIRTHIIPNRCQWCLLIWVLAGHMAADIWPAGLREVAAAAALVCLLTLAADLLYLHLRGVPVIGGGDLKLLCIAALALGARRVFLAFGIAVFLAAVCILVRGCRNLNSRIPMAPFLSMGFALACLVYP